MKNTIMIFSMLLTGCLGHKVSGKTEHVVKNEGPMEVVLKIDVSGCADFEVPEQKLECIIATVEVFKELNKSIYTVACYTKPAEEIETCVEGISENEIVTNLLDSGI